MNECNTRVQVHIRIYQCGVTYIESLVCKVANIVIQYDAKEYLQI
jgi:hypothetical protein